MKIIVRYFAREDTLVGADAYASESYKPTKVKNATRFRERLPT